MSREWAHRAAAEVADPREDDLRPWRRHAPGTSTISELIPRRPAQRRAAETAADVEAASPSVGGGSGLPSRLLEEMSDLFGHDFSSVRVKTDASAAAIGAIAYTAGDEIVFQPGAYDPGGASGRELLAHELAHVVQQAHGRVGASAEIAGVAVNDESALEREADEAAARVMRGEPAAVGGGGGGGAAIAQRRVAQRQDHGGASGAPRPGVGPTAPGSFLQLPIDDLLRLYLAAPAEAPITLNVAGAPVEYTAALLQSDTGRVRMRGALRGKLSELGGNPDELARLRALIAPRASEPAAQDVGDMIAQAVARSGTLGARATGSTAALVDAGSELPGRTWGPRTGDAHTVDGSPGRPMDGRVHAAMDVTGRSRTGVYAPCRGRVIEVRISPTYGNLLRLQHDDPPETACAGSGPLTTNYAHLDEILVTRGATIAAGEAIGMMGMTGLAPGVHLHWSVQRVPTEGAGHFDSDYEERPDIQIHPDVWLAEIGGSIAAPTAPRTRGRRPRRRPPARPASSSPTQRRVVQRFGPHDSDTMRAHRERGELHRRHAEVDGPEPSDGAVVHGGADARPPMSAPDLERAIFEQTERRRASTGSVVPADYVRRVLTERAQHADVAALWTETITAAGTASWEVQMSAIDARAPRLVHTVENHFINDPGGSGLDTLGAAGDGYRTGWGEHDFPGGPPGAGEGRARRMAGELGAVRPERRPNQGAAVVATEAQFDGDAQLRHYIAQHLVETPPFTTAPVGSTTIPVQPAGKQMLDTALEAFLRMRAAALADGVALVVGAGSRTREAAIANADAHANPSGVAAYSSHTLGLAIDLDMSTDQGSFVERETEPMQQVTDERTSPVHRWMFVRSAAYGWFPYQNEPWHWEYNPPGFREQFLAAAHGHAAAAP